MSPMGQPEMGTDPDMSPEPDLGQEQASGDPQEMTATARLESMAIEICESNPSINIIAAIDMAAETLSALSQVEGISTTAYGNYAYPHGRTRMEQWLMDAIHPLRTPEHLLKAVTDGKFDPKDPKGTHRGDGVVRLHAPGTPFHGMEIPYSHEHGLQTNPFIRQPQQQTRQPSVGDLATTVKNKVQNFVKNKFGPQQTQEEESGDVAGERPHAPRVSPDQAEPKYDARAGAERIRSKDTELAETQDSMPDEEVARHEMEQEAPGSLVTDNRNSASQSLPNTWSKRLKENPSATQARSDMDSAMGDEDGDADDSGGDSDDA